MEGIDIPTNDTSTPLEPKEIFAYHEKDSPREYTSLDDCIDHSHEVDCFPISQLIRGHKIPKRRKSSHAKPIAMVMFKATLGKGKAIAIKALLDSGGAGTLLTARAAKRL